MRDEKVGGKKQKVSWRENEEAEGQRDEKRLDYLAAQSHHPILMMHAVWV